MKKSLLVIMSGVAVAIVAALAAFSMNSDMKKDTQSSELEIVDSHMIFKGYVDERDIIKKDDQEFYTLIRIELDPTRKDLYQKIGNPKRTAVIVPLFTATAYAEPGFYTYYRGECDTSCLTRPIIHAYRDTASVHAIQVFKLLNYTMITDLDVDKDPSIVNRFDKLVILHNEYVTKKEFDAITNHPKVVYLYPNALYAEIRLNSDNTITLIRGHNYPEHHIKNGFDWEYDNTPYEYDHNCNNMMFEQISNGIMLNCYPENEILFNAELLQFVKDY
ncbi:MAG: hypothetical protein QXW91_00460 [Candidatus Nitrosotenuis sp.]